MELPCNRNFYLQWQVGNAGGQFYGRTDPAQNIFGIGIGDFPNGTPPLSALHINANAPFPGNIFWQAGEVFRTDCPQDISTYWRQQRGGFEYGTIYSLNAADDFTGQDFHFYIQASFADDSRGDYGDIRFNNGSHNALGLGTPRMRILGSNGFVGIGDYTTFTPKSLLDVNGTITAKQIIISNENDTIDLMATIKSLEQQLTELKVQITALKN